jgi:hypothetical protein
VFIVSEAKPGLAAALSGFGEAHTRAAPAGAGEDPAGDSRQVGELGRDRAPPADLFGLPKPETSANAVANRGGAGRPPGAINKRTGDLKRYILSLGYKDPAIVLADISSASPKQLMKALPGLKAGEALGAKQRAAEKLMEYFYQKQPTAIELPPNDGRPLLAIGEMVLRRHTESGEAMSLDDAIDDAFGIEPLNEEDQALSEAENVRPEFSTPNDEG